LDDFLSVFWLVQETLSTTDEWARATYESLLDAAPHGLRYREMFFIPARHMTSALGLDLDELAAIALDGIEAIWLDEGEARHARDVRGHTAGAA
jgi:adenosine deaminase